MRPLLAFREPKLQIWPSYTDVAFNVILIFLIYLFVQLVFTGQSSLHIIVLEKKIEELERQISETSALMKKIDKLQNELARDIKSALEPDLRNKVKAINDGNLLRLTFSTEVLFDSAQAALKNEGQRILGPVGKVLKEKSNSFLNIQVEGHTDTRPIYTSEFKSNWELSSARATTVVRFLQEKSGLPPLKLSATGYSEYRPVDTGSTEEALARNRRIELVVVYSLHQEEKN
jgi:chemotaxis protein MotB